MFVWFIAIQSSTISVLTANEIPLNVLNRIQYRIYVIGYPYRSKIIDAFAYSHIWFSPISFSVCFMEKKKKLCFGTATMFIDPIFHFWMQSTKNKIYSCWLETVFNDSRIPNELFFRPVFYSIQSYSNSSQFSKFLVIYSIPRIADIHISHPSTCKPV